MRNLTALGLGADRYYKVKCSLTSRDEHSALAKCVNHADIWSVMRQPCYFFDVHAVLTHLAGVGINEADDSLVGMCKRVVVDIKATDHEIECGRCFSWPKAYATCIISTRQSG